MAEASPMTIRLATLPLIALSLLFSAGPRSLAWAEQPATAAKKPDAPKCDRAQFRVVVDVGHTPHSYGALSARNHREYDFNFELAWEIEHDLIDDGFAKTVLLVTDGAQHASLDDRVAAANRSSANLLLSIHHDSVPDKFLEKWNYEGKASHFSDRFRGHSLFVSNENREFQASVQFGKILGLQLKDRGLQYAHHYTQPFMGHRRRQLVDADAGVYRYDQLIVLRRTQMPAVLLEAGSIINRDEEVAMSSPEHRALISAAVTSAVEMFCEARTTRSEPIRTAAPAPVRTIRSEPIRAAAPEPVGAVRSEPTRTEPTGTVRSEPVGTPVPQPVRTATPEQVGTVRSEPVATPVPEPVRTAAPEPVHTIAPEPAHASHPETIHAVHSQPAHPAVTPVAANTATRPTGMSWLLNLFTRQSSTNSHK
jgi:N-acetylmuramoyl-L-alanine amidase